MLSAYGAQILAAIRMSFADRTNFILQLTGMALNNGFFLLLWVLFFMGFRSVGGWQLRDICLLLGTIMTVVGIAGVCIGGYRDMAVAILHGEADVLLTQPRLVLPRLLARESIAHAWGDLVTGAALLATLGGLDGMGYALAVLGALIGVIIYVSAAVTFASLAFWISGARSFARDLTDFLLLLCSYPGSIYTGMAKLIAYSILPAGFVVLVPVQMLRQPTLANASVAVAATLFYATLAVLVFQVGLRRYQRGLTPISRD
jgi:ABC-2 type transport system permease protein